MGFFTRVFRLHFSLWLGLAVLAGVALAMPASAGSALRLAAGWDAGVAAFLVVSFVHILRSRSQAAIRRRAAEMDQAGKMVLPLSLAAALASIVVLVLVMMNGGKPSPAQAGFSILTVGLSLIHI